MVSYSTPSFVVRFALSQDLPCSRFLKLVLCDCSDKGSTGCKVCTYSTYLLTPWCRVLLEKLTGLQLVKKFPAFHGTRRFITVLTSFRHLSLSRAYSGKRKYINANIQALSGILIHYVNVRAVKRRKCLTPFDHCGR